MGYSTFKQAKGFVEMGYGECDEAKLARVVNTIRQHFYNWYDELSLFLDVTESFHVQRFEMNGDAYSGVTLPRDFQQVEAMWWNDWPVALKSSWKEFSAGISSECDCRLQKFDVAGLFSTALDLFAGQPKRLQVRAFDVEDTGKRIVIRGRAATGQPYSEEIFLNGEVQSTLGPFASIESMGGIIKDLTHGQVVMSDEDGRMLSIYQPGETVPAYKRIKITGLPHGCSVVNIRASRRYFPLTGDDETVETDNAVAFDAMARYLRLYERSDKTPTSVQVEKDHYATAMKMMMGDKARETGRATQAEVTFLTPRFGGGQRLNRGGRRAW